MADPNTGKPEQKIRSQKPEVKSQNKNNFIFSCLPAVILLFREYLLNSFAIFARLRDVRIEKTDNFM